MDDFLDIKQASILLNCHPVTLTRKAQNSEIPAYKRLNKWLFKRADLMALFVPNKAVSK
jgi:excisionase family DNA binding protein